MGYVKKECRSCSGTGKETCGSCGGRGYTQGHWNSERNDYSAEITCSRCGGTGKMDCYSCNGRGFTEEYESDSSSSSYTPSSSGGSSSRSGGGGRRSADQVMLDYYNQMVRSFNKGSWNEVIETFEEADNSDTSRYFRRFTSYQPDAGYMVEAARANTDLDYDYEKAFRIADWGEFDQSKNASNKEIMQKVLFNAGKNLFQKKHGRAVTDADLHQLHTNYCENKIADYVRRNNDCWEDDIYEWERVTGKKMTAQEQMRVAGRTFKVRTEAEERAKRERAEKRQRVARVLSPFAIVDSGSGEGSTIIFGALGALIGLAVGYIIGGMIGSLGTVFGCIIGGGAGWSLGSKLIGEHIHIYLGKLILYFILLPMLVGGGFVLYYKINPAGFISLLSRTPKAKIETTQTLAITQQADITQNVNFRKDPALGENIIRQLKKGDIVTLTGEVSSGWTQITHNDDTGWVSSEFLKVWGEEKSSEVKTTEPKKAEPKAAAQQAAAQQAAALTAFPSDFTGTWKRDNYNNTLTFTGKNLKSSSQSYSWNFVSESNNAYTIRSEYGGTAQINIRLANNNIEISEDSGGGEDNWNGTWVKQ